FQRALGGRIHDANRASPTYTPSGLLGSTTKGPRSSAAMRLFPPIGAGFPPTTVPPAPPPIATTPLVVDNERSRTSMVPALVPSANCGWGRVAKAARTTAVISPSGGL